MSEDTATGGKSPPSSGKAEAKSCTVCKASLPLDRFGKDRSRSDGHTHRCKECDRKRSAARRSEAKMGRPRDDRTCQRCGESLARLRSDANLCPRCRPGKQCWGCGRWLPGGDFDLIPDNRNNALPLRFVRPGQRPLRLHDYCRLCVQRLRPLSLGARKWGTAKSQEHQELGVPQREGA